MRLISLILALVGIVGVIIYAKDSINSKPVATDQTVKQQTRQLIDDAQQTVDEVQKKLEEQQKKMEELNQ